MVSLGWLNRPCAQDRERRLDLLIEEQVRAQTGARTISLTLLKRPKSDLFLHELFKRGQGKRW